jgi:predicted DsbA family dithiol-disulfide isomerase
MFTESRCIALRHVILEVADESDGVDARRLADDLDAGVARRRVIEEWRRATAADVKGSPHLFLPDGSDMHNPGLRIHGDPGGFPVIDADDPSVYEDMLKRAANDS